jgi:hypothetical protein
VFNKQSELLLAMTTRLTSGVMLQLFNITLSHDKRSILLNHEPFFPRLPTIPTPPTIHVPELRPNFSYRNLSFALACHDPYCRPESAHNPYSEECAAWCSELQLGIIPVDYMYITKGTKYNGSRGDAGIRYWEFNVDAIGRGARYLKDPKMAFDNTLQKMLRVVVEGTELKKGRLAAGQDTLFSPFDQQEKSYEYRIVGVELVERAFKFSVHKPLTLFQSISRFFGKDVWEAPGRLVYMRNEWGLYGKEGTLRNIFGDFVHWHSWYLVGIIVGSLLGGLLVFYGMYRFFLWIQEQRELMKWDGMDDVWDKLRREREEEENALLDGRYRDEPDEGDSPRPPRYTDDLDTMKPLPKKPLPEKPLPAVPLIDA